MLDATLEVVAEMLDAKMFDIAQRILDVDERKLEMGPQSPRKDARRKHYTVDRCNDIASRVLDARGTTIDFNAWASNVDRWKGMLTKGVDGGKGMLTKGIDGCKIFGRMSR